LEVIMLRKFGTGMLVVAAAAACGDSTGPENFDPVNTSTKADAVLAAFDNPALLSLGALQNLSFGPLLSATVPPAPTASTLSTAADRLRAWTRTVPNFGSASPLAIFPADLLGATFVWDEAQDRYVEDPEATGAPANGVRVLLYTVDPISHLPVSPLDDRGYLDIMDESTPSVDALHLVAVWEGVTHLDYVASATTTTTSLTLSAEGFVANGTDRVDFVLTFSLTQTDVSVNYQLTHGDDTLGLTGTLNETSFTVTLTLSDGDNTITFQITVTPSTVEGSIEYNGEVAVEIGGTPEAPTFTRADGTPLTAEELAALQHLGDLINVITDHFDDLLGPAIVAFLLG
jgi:hypothetical protein